VPDAEELDQETNRQRLLEQAQAETANARRVEQLSASGRKLAEEASRNEGFDAKRLDAFAKAIQKLDEIAKEKMPSVADLLKDAAEAPNAPSQGKPSDQKTAQQKSGEQKSGEQKPGDQKQQEQQAAAGASPPKESPATPPDQDLKSLSQQKPEAGAAKPPSSGSSPAPGSANDDVARRGVQGKAGGVSGPREVHGSRGGADWPFGRIGRDQ